MSEPVLMALLLLGPALWMAGGRWWKGCRRFVWPLALGIALLGAEPGRPWPIILLVVRGYVLVNSLPYGARKPMLFNAGVFPSYAMPVAFLRLGICLAGLLASGMLLTGLYWLSRRFNRVTWKVWEATAGLLQAGLVIMAS